MKLRCSKIKVFYSTYEKQDQAAVLMVTPTEMRYVWTAAVAQMSIHWLMVDTVAAAAQVHQDASVVEVMWMQLCVAQQTC